jgi:hypothetical protein
MTVTVQSALSDVQASARRLGEIARELVLTAVEDQPRHCQVHLITIVHDAALDVAAETEQAYAAVDPERGADGDPSRAVARCQHHVALAGAALVRELAAPELLNDLAALGRERGREVSTWVAEVNRRIQACQIALWTDAHPALLGYWQELADLTNRTCVSGDGR